MIVLPTGPAARAAAILVAAVLLVLPNLLLWRLVEKTPAQPVAAAAQAPAPREAAPAEVPEVPLPEPEKNSGSRALLQGLDQTTQRFTGPLGGLRRALNTTNEQTAVLDEVPPALRGLLRNTEGLRGIRGDLGALTRQTKALDSLENLDDLERTLKRLEVGTRDLKELRELKRVSGLMGELSGRLDRFQSTLTGTNDGLGAINETLKDTNRKLEHLGKCLEKPVLCR